MAKICMICGKGKSVGHTRKLLRGHYNVTSRRTFKPNLQKVRYEGHRVWGCVQCIRSMHKEAKA